MNLDPQVANGRQAAVHQQSLVEQAGGGLDQVRLETLGEADRIIRGVGGYAHPREQSLVTHALEATPVMRPICREQVAGRLDHDCVSLVQAQAGERRAGLGLDILRTAVATRRLDGHPKADRPRHDRAQHGFAMHGGGAGVQHGKARSRGDAEHIAHLRLGRSSAPAGAVQPELRGAEAELRGQ